MQDFNKATSDFINSIKDKSIKEQALKAKAEFEKKTKDLLKGDGFFMSKPDLKPAKSDLTISVAVDATLKKNLKLNADELKADLYKLKEAHPESFKSYGSVARVIKVINDNPTHFIKNNRLDMELVGKFLESGKFGEMGVVTQGKNTGNVGHLLVTSKGDKRVNNLNKRNKNSAVGTGNLQHTAHIEKADGRAGTTSALSPNSKDTLAEKSLNLPEAPKEKDLRQKFNNFMSEQKAKRKAKDDRIKDFKDRMKNLGKEKGNPLKEFGTNYPEYYHKGKEAISKLLSEASKAKKAGKLDSFNAQVAGAFHKEGLGDIDLVWGKVTDAQKHTGYGLAHILDKRASEFIKAGKSEQEAQKLVNKFIKDLPTLIKNGKVEIIEKRAFIRLDGLKGVVALDYKGKNSNKWILTFYKE